MSETQVEPVVLVAVSDVMFGVRIEEAARAQGYRVEWLAPGADVVHEMVAHQPGLFVVDIADPAGRWAEHIARAKSSPATRRIPIVAFGAHVDVDAAERARRAGADEVLARSRFVQALPELLARRARVMREGDWEALASQCGEPLPADIVRGLEEFNRGEYFECHETLEHVWMHEERPVRDLYRAVLQVAVAYHHAARGNWPGALKMFARAKQWFNRLPERCQGVELAQLWADALRVEEAVRQAQAEGKTEIARELMRPVAYQAAGDGAA